MCCEAFQETGIGLPYIIQEGAWRYRALTQVLAVIFGSKEHRKWRRELCQAAAETQLLAVSWHDWNISHKR